MKALWRRRAARHVLVALLPLLVVGPAIVALLAVRFADVSGPLREATARATATAQRVGLGPDGRDIEVSWTDETGAARTSTVRAGRATEVPVGAQVIVRYRPGAPDRVFVTGDETSARLNDLTFGIALAVLVTGIALGVSAVHLRRRLAAERLPAAPVTVGRTRSRAGLLRRSWLVVPDQGRTWWVPVHWEPALTGLEDRAEVRMHGRPSRHRLVTFDVDGTSVWQAGRHRLTAPRGEVDPDDAGQAPAPPTASLRRQFRADAGLLAAAPVLGLLWAYVDQGGAASGMLAALLAAAVLVWVPSVLGSDPT